MSTKAWDKTLHYSSTIHEMNLPFYFQNKKLKYFVLQHYFITKKSMKLIVSNHDMP